MVKTIIKPITLCFLIFLSVLSSCAQEIEPADVEKAKSILQRERETIFIEALHLSTSQAIVFHPIYVRFSKEKRVLDNLLIASFLSYTDNYQRLDKKVMHAFLKQSKQHQKKELHVRRKYYKQISNLISVELASQFYEVDDFLSTILRLNILTGLPFTGSITQHVTNQ